MEYITTEKFEHVPRSFYFAMVLLYLVAFAIGYWIGETNRSFADEQFGAISDAFAPLADLSAFVLFLVIFLNNTIKSFLAVVLGVFFGIFSVYFVLANALILGIFVSLLQELRGIDFVLAGLLPHGVLETIALIISAAYGMWLGVHFLRYLKSKESIKPAFKRAVASFGKIIVPLLLLSALIEVFVTPLFIQMTLE